MCLFSLLPAFCLDDTVDAQGPWSRLPRSGTSEPPSVTWRAHTSQGVVPSARPCLNFPLPATTLAGWVPSCPPIPPPAEAPPAPVTNAWESWAQDQWWGSQGWSCPRLAGLMPGGHMSFIVPGASLILQRSGKSGVPCSAHWGWALSWRWWIWD